MHDPVLTPSGDAARLVRWLLALVIVTNACADATSPTEVSHVDEPSQHATIDASAALSSIDDALSRIVSTLDDPATAAPLRAALLELRIPLAAGGAAPGNATEAAARAVDAYGRSTTGEDAELDAIRLALDVAVGSRGSDGPTR